MHALPYTLFAALSFGVSARYQTSAAPRDGMINVHLVPHTHDDAGWLKTVDEYYAGQNNSIQHAGVHYILDSVIRQLEENPDRKFVYVEQAFFQRWWRQQGTAVRALTRRLVANGQLQMINGAWVMHCEATPHFIDMIDQTRLGHKFLMDEFGILPKIGWQIDPFGHSATQAALLSAETGFVGLFFGRIDYQDLALRIQKREAEFIWRASPSLGSEVQVFTGLTGSYGGNYGPPAGFCWDHSCDDEPIQDDPELGDVNVKSRVDDFVKFAMWQANHTNGKHIMMTMGSDFQYEAAANWYTNLDKLIHYVNKDGRVNAFYSNPEMYIAAKAEENISWPLKTDDFFPYADGPHQFWTGYFTSRPSLKRFVRDSSAFFQVSKQLLALGLPSDGFHELEPLAEAMGLLQHHDAVAGTEKQHAAFDYAKRLSAARARAVTTISKALARLTNTAGTQFTYCVERNVSICEATQRLSSAGDVPIVFWNGLGHARVELVELPVSTLAVQMVDQDNAVVPMQVVKSLPSITDYGKPAGGAAYTLLFEANLPALGFKSYHLRAGHAALQPQKKAAPQQDILLENEYLQIKFCAQTGRMCEIMNKEMGTSITVDQDWFWYRSSTGNKESSQPSGAYIFRPNSSNAERVFNANPELRITHGDLADEVLQTFGRRIAQRVRLAKGERHIELTYTVAGLPIGDKWGKELVSRITTNIRNDGACYTDSNGREMIYRKRDYRPTWHLNQTEPVAGNYFPIGTTLFIRDGKAQLTVLTDRVQAGTGCVQDGTLELMVDRRLLEDDSRGVGEPLNETEYVTPYLGKNQGQHYGSPLVVRGQHFITLVPPLHAASVWRPLQDRVYMPPAPFFAQAPAYVMPRDGRASMSALRSQLPPNMQLITLEPLSFGSSEQMGVFMRLGHRYGVGEDAELSKPAEVDLATLFDGQAVSMVQELSLSGTTTRTEVLKRRINWQIDGEVANSTENIETTADYKYKFGPLQIRTFNVTFAAPLETEIFV